MTIGIVSTFMHIHNHQNYDETHKEVANICDIRFTYVKFSITRASSKNSTAALSYKQVRRLDAKFATF